MRKCVLLLLVLALLCPVSASAAEGKTAALTFEGFPPGAAGQLLLAQLRSRGIRATFFLWDAEAEDAARIVRGDHELGLLVNFNHETLSRRKIADSLAQARDALPPEQRIRLLRPLDDCSDGLRQVARVRGLTLLGWSQDPAAWVSRDTAAVSPGTRVRDGDIIRIPLGEGYSVESALELADHLRAQGFRFVTVSELARLQGVPLQPGRVYRSLNGRKDGL